MDDGNSIATHISSPITGDILDRAMFANAIMTDRKRRKGEQRMLYKLEDWKKIGTFGIMNNISKYVTLVQLMDSVGNMNIAVSVVCKRIFD